jgi:8-oxo-dGTP diphosphatase
MLWQRATEPFTGAWALPGGPLLPGETLGASVARQLASKVEVSHLGHLEQLATPTATLAAAPSRRPTWG